MRTRDLAGVFRNTMTTDSHVILEWDYVDRIELYINYTRTSQNLSGASSTRQIYTSEPWIWFPTANSESTAPLPGPAGPLDMKDYTIDAYAFLGT